MRLLLFLSFFFSGFYLSAQPKHIRFDNLGINDGLSQSLVNDIIQDKKGFIWIATQDGLNKYDGISFTTFKRDPENENTLSNNFINSLLEDRDGKIWLATNGGGICVFDVLTESFSVPSIGDQNRNVTDIVQDKEGMIWFSTSGNGINKYDSGKKRVLAYVFKGVEAKNVQKLFIDTKGNLFAATAGHGLLIYNRKFDRFDKVESSLIDEVVWSITEDSFGAIWLGTNRGLVKMIPDGTNFVFKRFIHEEGNNVSLANNTVRTVYVTKSKLLIIGTTGSGINILDLTNRKEQFYQFKHHEYIPYSLSDDLVQCIHEDRSGSIWIGTNEGLSRFDPSKQIFGQLSSELNNNNSLNDKTVWCITEDKNNVLFIGTRQGLNRYDRNNNTVYRYDRKASNANALNNNSILSLYVDQKGSIYAGAVDGLFLVEFSPDYRQARFKPVNFRSNTNQFSDNRVYYIVEEEQTEILWVATKEGLSRINKSTGEFNFYQSNENDPNSLPNNSTRLVYIDRKGNTWVSCDGEGIAKVVYPGDRNPDGVTFKPYKKRFGKSFENTELLVTSIWEDEEGNFWIGTYGSGLIHYDPVNEKMIKTYTEKDGLSNNSVYGIVGDDNGFLWMSTNYGLSRLEIKTKKFRNYLQRDGLQSNEFNTGSYFKSKSGEIFFGGINGLNWFDPNQLFTNTTPPEVVISGISLFNKKLQIDPKGLLPKHPAYLSELVLGYRENSITINFSALHYSNPANNKFRYFMDGLDEDYIEAGTTHEANYNKIPHGEYIFKVYACNSDGVWSEQPAQLKIIIRPPFWATWWFRMLVIIFAFGLILAFNRARVNNMKKQRLRLAREVRERTAEVMEQKEKIELQKKVIEEEKNKVEKLLLNILPEETAEELKSRGKASARSYRQVSVMFTDFVGFTKIAETMRPSDLVTKLDSYFVQFDEIIQKYSLEKIKTIGDSYMCAGGVPIRSKNNPIDTVLAALEIQRYMKELKEKSPDNPDDVWDLRIGINTGEIIAGVIGTKRFAYDIWGNTVNTANRLQMTSEVNMINISGTTFAEIEPYFSCTYRGKIAAKNKGEIDMYYVHGIKPELSVDELGIEPNEKFWKYVDLYLYSSINYRKAERHIMKVLREGLPSHLHYHGIHHTLDVVSAAERLALMEGITDEQMFILKSAATYHDAGFVEQYAKNEPIGIRMAQEILPKYGYTPEQVEEVAKLIRATIIPHDPHSLLEEIICDSDLDYLGRDDFHEIADTLRLELREAGIVNSDRGWDEMQIKFLNMHKYFTKSAIKMRQAKKEQHIKEIEERLKTHTYKD